MLLLVRPYGPPAPHHRPLENGGGGTLFATLPLNASLPFGIHIQADWLLDLARQVRIVVT